MRVRCGELVALEMLARGTRREELAILARESCGESGLSTAAAIHKDILVASLPEAVGFVRGSRMAGREGYVGLLDGRPTPRDACV